MIRIFCGGYCFSNEHSRSGGYALVAGDGTVIKCEEVPEPCRSGRQAEIHGLCRAIEVAHDGDTVVSSSQAALSCLKKGRSKKCPALNAGIARAKGIAAGKGLRLEFCPAERNLAALYNNRSTAAADGAKSPDSSQPDRREPEQPAASAAPKRKIIRLRLHGPGEAVGDERAEDDVAPDASSAAVSSEDAGPPELDARLLIRPDQFYLPEVAGLAIATTLVIDDEPVEIERHYVRWSDGRREQRPIEKTLVVGDRRYLIHPPPEQPDPAGPPGWSFRSRTAWLEGGPAAAPRKVFSQLCDRISRHIDLGMKHGHALAAVLALWVFLTYIFRAFSAVPYLFVTGPLNSGKSRLLEVLAQLVFRPFASSNMTAATLFRTLHGQGGTVLLDEAERLRRRNEGIGPLLDMLLAGYRHGGRATRMGYRAGKPGALSYQVYGPKALACINEVPATLMSRCINIPLTRALTDSPTAKNRFDPASTAWQSVRDNLHTVVLEHGKEWLELPKQTDICKTLGNRDFELWQPIMAIASWFESHGVEGLLALVRQYAMAEIARKGEYVMPEADEVLLRAVTKALLDGNWPAPHEILETAKKSHSVLFAAWLPRGVSARLALYCVTATGKSGSRREFREDAIDALREVQARYGLDLSIPESTRKTEKPRIVRERLGPR